jgi:alkaline phosphatase D
MDRRRFLQLGAAAGALTLIGAERTGASRSAISAATGRAYTPVPQFPSGVISGDPTADGFVLWTRVDPAIAGAGADVGWQVATDAAISAVIASGTAPTTSPDAGHTVHVEVDGLDPATTYWYRFSVDGTTSPVGRTRTMPAGSVDQLRIAFISCQRWVHGYYTAHADLAALALDPATDVDLVVSLGDYIYEAGPADGVTVDGREDSEKPQNTLAEYRRQYDLYRSDANLQAVHAAYPLAPIFDNHDGMSGPGDGSAPGAIAAFFEQMPVRRFAGDPDRQYRSLALGDLAELILLEERQHRDPTPDEGENPLGTSTLEDPAMMAEDLTMLGAAQFGWLKDTLSASTAAWKIVGSQLMFSPLRSQREAAAIAESGGTGPQRNAGRYVNMTQWDGYQAERRRILEHLDGEGIEDVMVIAGDTHFWTTSEVQLDYDDPDSPYLLTEFGGSSISSANAGEMTNLPGNDLIRPVVAAANPYSLRYMEVETHGYGLIELTADKAVVWYRSPASIAVPTSTTSVLAAFEVERGSARVVMIEGDDFLPPPDADPDPESTTTTTAPGGTPQAPAAQPVGGQATYTG